MLGPYFSLVKVISEVIYQNYTYCVYKYVYIYICVYTYIYVYIYVCVPIRPHHISYLTMISIDFLGLCKA